MANLDKIRYANGRTPTADLRLNMQKVGTVLWESKKNQVLETQAAVVCRKSRAAGK